MVKQVLCTCIWCLKESNGQGKLVSKATRTRHLAKQKKTWTNQNDVPTAQTRLITTISQTPSIITPTTTIPSFTPSLPSASILERNKHQEFLNMNDDEANDQLDQLVVLEKDEVEDEIDENEIEDRIEDEIEDEVEDEIKDNEIEDWINDKIDDWVDYDEIDNEIDDDDDDEIDDAINNRIDDKIDDKINDDNDDENDNKTEGINFGKFIIECFKFYNILV
jgi:DNA primase